MANRQIGLTVPCECRYRPWPHLTHAHLFSTSVRDLYNWEPWPSPQFVDPARARKKKSFPPHSVSLSDGAEET